MDDKLKDDEKIKMLVEQELNKKLSDPIFVIEAYQKRLEETKLEISILKPKAEKYDIILSTENTVEMSTVAKEINFKGMGRNNLFNYLIGKKILRFNNEPYQEYVDKKLFKIIPVHYVANGVDYVGQKTMTTQKGIDFITTLLIEDGYVRNF